MYEDCKEHVNRKTKPKSGHLGSLDILVLTCLGKKRTSDRPSSSALESMQTFKWQELFLNNKMSQ